MSKRIGWAAVLGLTASLGLVPAAPGGGQPKLRPGEFRLFNGRNLDNWDTWLGKPHNGSRVLGLNNDPKRVFSVVDFEGQPAIRISGEIYGALTTRQEYENYSIRLEFKWGQKKWRPRSDLERTSGLLYHCVGPHGAAESYWMQSLECQIMENHCGDFWSVADAIASVRATPLRKYPFSAIRYDPNGKNYNVPRRVEWDEVEQYFPSVIKRGAINEFLNEWNTIEVQTVGTTSALHLVNGKVVMVLNDTRRLTGGLEEPLKRGKIQLQSEGAEVYFRNIVLRPIDRLSVKR